MYIQLLTCNCHLPQTSAVLQCIEQNSDSSECVHIQAVDLQITGSVFNVLTWLIDKYFAVTSSLLSLNPDNVQEYHDRKTQEA